MTDNDFDRRTALRLLGVGALAATGTGVTAADDHHDDDHHDDDDHHGMSMPELWIAHLRPQEGVQTKARGAAVFQPYDGRMPFVLGVANVEDVFMAHIHEDQALGPVAVWLHDFATRNERPVEGRFTGMLDAGTITDESVAEGRAEEAASANLGDLLGKIEAGEAYVNVHTEAHPEGELAGRIQRFDWGKMDPATMEWMTEEW